MSEQIVVKSMKDKARDLINIYHDSPENFLNMLKENIANSLDIFKKNFPNRKDNQIKIILHNSNKIEFIDNASGIPVEGIASDGRPNYEAIFEIDGAGSNYSKDIDSAGQHGVFLYTLSMSAEDIEYFIARPNGNVYNIAYHKGDKVKDLNIVEKNHDKNNTYTRIIFSLDNEVWVNPSFTFEEICTIAQPQSSLYSNLTITVEDKQQNLTEVFHYDNSLIDYFDEQTHDMNIVTDTIHIETIEEYKFKKMGTNTDLVDNIKIDLYFNYNNDNEHGFKKEFVNTADLIQFSTVQEGIIDGLRFSINKWLDTNGKYDKKERHISNDDVHSCLNYICDVRCKYIKYAGQIKQSTKDNKFKMVLSKIMKEYLEFYFIENPKDTNKICTQVLINSRARGKAETSRKSIRKELEEKVSNITTRPEKFVACRSTIPSEIELILIEGDSAKNPIKSSRSSYNQCIYPLKGKPINGIKNNVDKLLANQEVRDIFKILGCGLTYNGKAVKGLPTFNIDNLQVGKIIIMTDRDTDGLHIECLLLSIFHILAPELIKQGKIYILMTPLYIITQGKNIVYAYTENERNDIVKAFGSKVFTEVRYKGIGGLSVLALKQTAMNIDKRIMYQYTWEDGQKNVDMINMCLSDSNDNALKRKLYIEKNGSKYFDYSLIEN